MAHEARTLFEAGLTGISVLLKITTFLGCERWSKKKEKKWLVVNGVARESAEKWGKCSEISFFDFEICIPWFEDLAVLWVVCQK